MTHKELAIKIMSECRSEWNVAIPDEFCDVVADAIRAAVEEERAECARLAEEFVAIGNFDPNMLAIAAYIRARGKL